MPFFTERNDQTAIRAVLAAMGGDHPIAKNAEDYSLFWIGQWDQEKGTIDTPATPRHVADCWALKANQE